ncbi:hypothetical protein OIU77_015681 [Salix suchowensis]|uniref:Uncharacterized protein n=1 Tax=Salix suchowensis TaxID=1278906 RepID=A0ABQ8ZHT5_9ROSI|nr:hypothetical protein OIU77_015681 [Salix suchowensis]
MRFLIAFALDFGIGHLLSQQFHSCISPYPDKPASRKSSNVQVPYSIPSGTRMIESLDTAYSYRPATNMRRNSMKWQWKAAGALAGHNSQQRNKCLRSTSTGIYISKQKETARLSQHLERFISRLREKQFNSLAQQY